MGIEVIGLDGDDTLWHSESFFAVTEERFRALLEPWLSPDEAAERLLERERANLALFGYGVKGFTLSMVETAIEASGGRIPSSSIQAIIDWGKELSCHPVELLDGVADAVAELARDHRLLLVTKGDLFHQESKVAASGLAGCFDGIEIVAEKDTATYRRALARHGVDPQRFAMVGNSVRSDVLPVLELGARAVHIPYGITWGHEVVEVAQGTPGWWQLERLGDLPALLATADDAPVPAAG